MMSAAITPGIQPIHVRTSTIKTEPQPLSITDKGGKTIAKSTRQILIIRKLGMDLTIQKYESF
jgi:hypothetical protein